MITVTLTDGAATIAVSGESWEQVHADLNAGGITDDEIYALIERMKNPPTYASPPGRGSMSPPTRRLRTPPTPATNPTGPSGVVQCNTDEDDGPRCQECRGSIDPLTEEDAIELYGIVCCTRCGKDLE